VSSISFNNEVSYVLTNIRVVAELPLSSPSQQLTNMGKRTQHIFYARIRWIYLTRPTKKFRLCVKQGMLRSQIKLTSYDFSGLHITGKFDNRPGTGPFKKINLAWSHIERAPAGVCIWKHRPMPDRAPYGVVRDQPDIVRCLADFTRIFTCNDEYICISKFAIIPSKKQFVKIRKIEADSDSDGDEKHTCWRLQKYYLFVAC